MIPYKDYEDDESVLPIGKTRKLTRKFDHICSKKISKPGNRKYKKTRRGRVSRNQQQDGEATAGEC